MTFTVRINGDTDPANWRRDIPESALPLVVSGLPAGSYQVRREAASAWSAAVTVSAAASVPGAFGAGDWSVSAGNGSASVTVATLPATGGSAITAVQYRLNGGAWAGFGTALAGPGTRSITGLTNGTAYTVELRAVNAVGAGADSDDKSVTPAAPAGAAHVHFGGTTTIWAPQPSPALTSTEAALTFVGRYRITTTPPDTAQILFNTAAVQMYQEGAVQLSVHGAHGWGSTTPPATGSWTSFMLAVSSTANINGMSRRFWVNGTERVATATAGGALDASFGFTFMGFEYVADDIAIGDVEGIWMARGLLNPETHWTDFFEADGSLKALAAGGAVGGVSPYFHMRGNAAAWNGLVDLNGRAFTRSGPAVTDAA